MLSLPDFREKQILFAMLSHGDSLSFKNDNIVIRDYDSKIKHQSTCYRLFMLFVVGSTTITSGLLERAEKFGFGIIFMRYNFRVYGSWLPRNEGNVLLRKKQYEYTDLGIARYVVLNKIENQLATLKLIRNKDFLVKDSISKMKEYLRELAYLTQPDLQQLLGMEGVASRVYFSALFVDYDWKGRRPRVKHDTINCLLDIGYTFLFNFIDGLLAVYGFDVYCGVYHRMFYQRKSLVCDLVEPIRPLIDYRIRKAYNLSQVEESDFTITQGQYRLYGKKAKPYTSWMLQELLDNREDIFLYIQRYYRAFMKDNKISDYPVFSI